MLSLVKYDLIKIKIFSYIFVHIIFLLPEINKQREEEAYFQTSHSYYVGNIFKLNGYLKSLRRPNWASVRFGGFLD